MTRTPDEIKDDIVLSIEDQSPHIPVIVEFNNDNMTETLNWLFNSGDIMSISMDQKTIDGARDQGLKIVVREDES